MENKRLNVRVYGIEVKNNKVLVTDERRGGFSFTKFVGGGLEWGEGTIDCLKREFREELSAEIEVLEHFYTTDFFQQSAFAKNDQLISIYYLIRVLTPFKPSTRPFNFEEHAPNGQSFRYIPLVDLKPTHFTFPIDKQLVGKIARLA